MNISRENLSELDLCIKIDIEENDYIETVKKQLKDYQRKAVIPGFRKGMAPMGMIQRMYKGALTSDTVQSVINSSLFKYIDDEKLDVLGMPLANDEKTGNIDFDKQTSFTFYFDAAVAPEFEIAWDKIDVKYPQVSVSTKEVDAEELRLAKQFGKFESPEAVGAGCTIYGQIVELDKNGQPKEDGKKTFASLDLNNLKDAESISVFEGKKAEEKVVFNLNKLFPTADVEFALRVDTAEAKKFKSDVEFTISGIAHTTPHELDDELFHKAFPTQQIKDADAFRKAIKAKLQKENDQQSDSYFNVKVRKALLDQFTAPLPEAFLKRWMLSLGQEGMTSVSLEEGWESEYLPSIKWEVLEAKLQKIKPLSPSQNDVVEAVKDILRRNDRTSVDEPKEKTEERIDQAARSIAAERSNVRQLVDMLYNENLASLLKEQIKPETEKVSAKEFAERLSNM